MIVKQNKIKLSVMKKIAYKIIIISILLVINASVFAQTYSVNLPSGTYSVPPFEEYSDTKTLIWNIDIGSQKPVMINYQIDIIPNIEFVDIYAFNGSGSAYSILTVTGSCKDSISTILPNGKARVQFRIKNGGAIGNYTGLTFSFSEDNTTSSTSVSNNAFVNQGLYVSGSTYIGGGGYNNTTLQVAGNNNMYSIYAYNNNSNSNVYGIYSSAINTTSGSAYGLYSSVGGPSSSNKWAGYFTGGNVQVNGGNLLITSYG